MIVDAGSQVAKLRVFCVDPKARGLGVGKRLVEESIQFSKRVGYQKIILWTQSQLLSARHIYQKAGFKLIEEKPETIFGHDSISESWELQL